MSKFLHIVLQIAGVAVQVGTVAGHLVPGPWQPVAVAATAALQGALAILNHKN